MTWEGTNNVIQTHEEPPRLLAAPPTFGVLRLKRYWMKAGAAGPAACVRNESSVLIEGLIVRRDWQVGRRPVSNFEFCR